jgi:phage gp16-like protein
MGKVEALLAEAGRPWAYADALAVQMWKIQRVEWLDDNQLQRLMQALIIDAGRHGRPIR